MIPEPTPLPDPVDDGPEALIQRRWPGVYRYLRTLGAGVAVAEDLAQETFVLALHKGLEDRGRHSTSTWLRRTARHLFLKSLRGKKAESLAAPEAVWDHRAGGEDGDAYADALRQCLPTLTDRARHAVDWTYGERAGRATIAERLGMTADGVKTLLRRARQTLRTCIDNRLGTETGGLS